LSGIIDYDDNGPIELGETISQREYNARRRRFPRSPAELAQLAGDVADVLAKAPEELRDLAERLKTQSVSEIARDTGVPRTTLYEAVRHLRRRFESAGLKEYL
jgi:RNA polymerase sigma-70 factor (ECF subfamily)